MKKALFTTIGIFLFFCVSVVGCKHEIEYRTEYRDVIKEVEVEKEVVVEVEVAPRPTFNQIFSFNRVDDRTRNRIKNIYDTMADEELVDLKYNYYSAIPIFWYPNNAYNPQNTIEYKGNAIHIRGYVEETDEFNTLFMTALTGYKNDNLNQLWYIP
jgi:hypothetical protein